MKIDHMTESSKNITFGDSVFHANVAVYKLAARFLSCRAAKFVEHKTMERFGVTTTGDAPHGNLAKVAEHIAKYGEHGSQKAQRVLAVFAKYTLEQLLEVTPAQVLEQLPTTHFERLVGVAIVGANWAEHYGYAQIPQSVAVAHSDSSARAASAKDVLTAEQLTEAAVYGLTDPNELVWFRSCSDHGMSFTENGALDTLRKKLSTNTI